MQRGDRESARKSLLSDMQKDVPGLDFGTGESATVKGTIVSGGFLLVGARFLVLVIQTAAGLALARLLSPTEFGIVGMVTAVVNFALLFRDMGLSWATVQRADLDESQLSNLFWLNLALGAAGALTLCMLAPFLERFYQTRGVAVAVLTLSIPFVLNAASVQHAALLRRQFRFRELATADLASVTASSALAVGLAVLGVGVWALLIQQVVRAMSYLAIIVSLAGWKPKRPRRGSGTLVHVRFGLEILAFDVINYAGANLDKVLLGRFFGAEVVGGFSRAQDLVLLPISQLRGPMTAAAVPALASAAERGGEYRQGFLFISKLNAFVATPFLVLSALYAPFVVPWLLGPHWNASVPFFQLLSVSGIPKTIVGILGTHLIASGQSKRYLAWGTWHATVLAAGVVAAIPFGAIWVAKSLVITNWLVFLPSVFFALKTGHVDARSFLRVCLIPGAFGVGALLAALGTNVLIGSGVRAQVLAGSGVFLAVYSLQLLWDAELRQALRGAGKRVIDLRRGPPSV